MARKRTTAVIGGQDRRLAFRAPDIVHGSLKEIIGRPRPPAFARLVTEPAGQSTVRTTGSQGSGVLRSMSEANAIIVLHHDQGSVAPGDWVDCLPFDGLA